MRARARRHAAESPTRISIRTSYPSSEQHDGSGVEERGCGSDGGLEVLGETAIAPEPGEEALDHPAAGMHGKADLAGLFAHDLDDDPGGVRHSFGGIGAVSECTLDERIQRAGCLEQRDGAVSILHRSWMDLKLQAAAIRVD